VSRARSERAGEHWSRAGRGPRRAEGRDWRTEAVQGFCGRLHARALAVGPRGLGQASEWGRVRCVASLAEGAPRAGPSSAEQREEREGRREEEPAPPTGCQRERETARQRERLGAPLSYYFARQRESLKMLLLLSWWWSSLLFVVVVVVVGVIAQSPRESWRAGHQLQASL